MCKLRKSPFRNKIFTNLSWFRNPLIHRIAWKLPVSENLLYVENVRFDFRLHCIIDRITIGSVYPSRNFQFDAFLHMPYAIQ